MVPVQACLVSARITSVRAQVQFIHLAPRISITVGTSMLKAVSIMRPRYLSSFLWLLLLSALIIFALLGTGEEKFVQLHLVMDTTNAVLSLLLAVFLLGEQD